MYRSKQMQWGNVDANGMSHAVGQAAQATALLQEANKGLSGIGDSISKVGDSVTKYGTDMETRYNKEKTEIIEGIAHDIYNSAIADSTDANGKTDLNVFDKVVTMGITSLEQGDYAMDKKDVNSVLKQIHSLMNRSDATKNNVSIMNHNLAQSQFNHKEKMDKIDLWQNQYSTIQATLQDLHKSQVALYEKLPTSEHLRVGKELAELNETNFKKYEDDPVIKKINKNRKPNNKLTFNELISMLSSSTLESEDERHLMYIFAEVIGMNGVDIKRRIMELDKGNLGVANGQK